MNRSIHDHLWLWCHSAGSYNHAYNLPGESGLEPAAACTFLGVRNAIMVVYRDDPKPPFSSCAAQFANMGKVVWSIIGDSGSTRNNAESDLPYVLDLKATLPRLQGGIMDDFFGCASREDSGRVKGFADILHAAGLELWVVLYGHQLDQPRLQEFIGLCDVVSFWTWKASELPLLPERFQRLRQLAPGKRIALGCYLWDFGDKKSLGLDDMRGQCEFAFTQWRQGNISDIVLLGSPMVDMGVETVDWTRKWIASLDKEA